MTEKLETAGGTLGFVPLTRAADEETLRGLPYVIRIFLENALRKLGDGTEQEHVEALAGWPGTGHREIPFFPARVVLQDFTGVPVVADLAAMRAAVARLGGTRHG